jgi:hypothetical protein
MVSTLDLANVNVDGIPAIDLRDHNHSDRCTPPADRFRPAVRYVTTNGRVAPKTDLPQMWLLTYSGRRRTA